jgi:formate-dependent nitrite reductase membrane component NrfD
MTCGTFYASEYIANCDISKFGEGCEKCVPIFESNLMLPIWIIMGIVAFLGIIILITRMREEKHASNS